MSTLSYHFPEFAVDAVLARARRCHPLRIPVSPVGRPRKVPPNYSLLSYAGVPSVPPPRRIFLRLAQDRMRIMPNPVA